MLLGTRRATERSTGNKHRLLGRAYSAPLLEALGFIGVDAVRKIAL